MAYDPFKSITAKAKGGAKTLQTVASNRIEDIKSGDALNPLNMPGNQVRDLKTLNQNTVLPIVSQARKDLGKTPVEWSNKAEGWWTEKVRDPATGLYHKIEDEAGKLAKQFKGVLGPGGGIPGGGGQVGVPIMPGAGSGGLGGPVQIGGGPGADARGMVAGNPNEFRQYQTNLASQLAAQAEGRTPSLADMQFKQAQQANEASFYSQMASGRGNPLAARTAAMSVQQSQAQTARDAAMARLAEQQKAQELLGGVATQGRTADITQEKTAQDRAIAQAQLGQQYQELQAKYVGMGMDAQKANQLAAIDIERLKIQQQAAERGVYGDIFNAAGGVVKGVAGLFT